MFSEQNTEQKIVCALSRALADGAGWMKFLGALSIISGVLQVFSIVGLISGGIQIWMGVLLFQAAGAAEQARATGDGYALNSALGNIKTYFMVNGIFALIGMLLICATLCLFVFLPILGVIPFLIGPANFNNF